MKVNIIDNENAERKSVTVITPTIGKRTLWDAYESVQDQTYPNLKHLVVCDGVYNSIDLQDFINLDGADGLQVVQLKENTGNTGGKFYGHRIYAAFSHLVNSDYVAFLDEDNWYEPEHIETLVDALENASNSRMDFSYSLRKIYDKEGNYLLDDNCESLGMWPVWPVLNKPIREIDMSFAYLIDTSSFLFKREFIVHKGHHWHSGWGGDRNFLSEIMVGSFAKFEPTGKHTLCYRLDGNPNSVTEDFFIEGNKKQLEYYEGNLPWLKNE